MPYGPIQNRSLFDPSLLLGIPMCRPALSNYSPLPAETAVSRLDVCQPRRQTSVSPFHGRQQPAKPDTSVSSAAQHKQPAGAASHYTDDSGHELVHCEPNYAPT